MKGMGMLAVIDYGAGNLRSVLHALHYLGVGDIRVVRGPRDLREVDKIILPGVGAFGAGMQKLHEQDLVEPIKNAVFAGKPYLGICLGMQFLFERSDEMGNYTGLGLLPGYVTRFEPQPGLKIPHMGWNQLQLKRASPLMAGADAGYAYFVHSYYCAPAEQSDVVATVDYGGAFTAVVQRDHIYGVQFHPEKSQQMGLRILANFLEVAA
jgi:glutamine amidotransferase